MLEEARVAARADVDWAAEMRAQTEATLEAEVLPVARRCYEQALQDEPSLAGRLCIAFVVAPDGSATTNEEGCEAASPLDAIRPCVMEAVSAARFPSNDRGAVIAYERYYELPMEAEPAD